MRICLLNQFYAPDISPTAQLATSLIEHRAERGDECIVVCGSGGYASARDGRRLDPRVDVRRTWAPELARGSIFSRATTYTAYFCAALWSLLRMPRQDVIVAMTTPPFVYLVALAHKLRRRDTRVILWSMDVYPEVAERLRDLDGRGGLSSILRVVALVARRVNRWALPKLDSVVVLDGSMADLLVDAGAPPERVHVIPNWERGDRYPGRQPSDDGAAVIDRTSWDGYGRLGLTDDFVVLYAGNIGLGHRFDTVLAAADELIDDGVSFLFVGGGPRWHEVADHVSSAPNLHLHPYVDKDVTPSVLAGASAALICLDDDARGVMSPSKLHGSLGMGTPILYVGPAGSNVAEAIDRFGCGVRVDHGDVDALTQTLRAWRDDPVTLQSVSESARSAFELAYCDTAALPLWDALLDGPDLASPA